MERMVVEIMVNLESKDKIILLKTAIFYIFVSTRDHIFFIDKKTNTLKISKYIIVLNISFPGISVFNANFNNPLF